MFAGASRGSAVPWMLQSSKLVIIRIAPQLPHSMTCVFCSENQVNLPRRSEALRPLPSPWRTRLLPDECLCPSRCR